MESPAGENGIDVTTWADNAIEASGMKNTEVASLLCLTPASVSRIRKGKQALSAEHMLLLSRELKAPLPGEAPQEPEQVSRGLDMDLYLKALESVVEQNNRKPEPQRMNQFEILESVFFVYEALVKLKK
ncbi:MAG: helix-turn-helix transcriptional regulator [Roseibium album]|uniref:helix-turn-helix domain-containing protein n=1 Tax=Roseibium album TaxID=311410 RepID=UPI000CF156E3|nr:helix-turn-helix transcriptional regulator [Roseibium album]MBG6144821.1 transcriptional regulator with XRE-family HTH domain [Labrenzia sp. EL_142]MBG6156962.1 transcriptional regulator with XRE-family HTH domain [Labrenzia sp. EL_162]MBG6163427.1 transcriptional regulator with XRE-family HTH domain [Labrenzia sp. EL_195]MBG6172212.1 transcriptional regulator with XRE-family HTH domain [Labrenzia sp. EL_132]MBG6195097.1 transcriptional regulator with XRE-family HTH domain [Labrenzia sp. EL